MTFPEQLTHADSVLIAASPDDVYALVSDITRTGEWSPICRRAEWVDEGETGVGATFLGHNETSERSWTTTSTVVAADPGEHFAWDVADGFVHWGYRMRPVSGGTELTHEWEFLPAGQAFFVKRYGDDATAEISERTASARASIPKTLGAIKAILERR